MSFRQTRIITSLVVVVVRRRDSETMAKTDLQREFRLLYSFHHDVDNFDKHEDRDARLYYLYYLIG